MKCDGSELNQEPSVTARSDDRATRENVERELARSGLEDVRVRVSGGRLTLSGAVDSYAKKLAARDAAHRGSGAPDLTDDIQVRLPGTSLRTDQEVEEAARRSRGNP